MAFSTRTTCKFVWHNDFIVFKSFVYLHGEQLETAMLYDGLTSPGQALWKVRTCYMLGEAKTEDCFFLDERKAYGCYLDNMHSSSLPDRVVFMRRKGSEWEVLAEDGVWRSSWRPASVNEKEDAIQSYISDDKYIDEDEE